MNIYFACSITGGREFERVYQELTAALVMGGHDVPTAHLAESNVLSLEAVVEPREVYERDVAWIQAAGAVVAEVSVPSHGVGYEIGFALNAGKPVLCLFQEGRKVSKMISGNTHPKLQVNMYRDSAHAIKIMKEFLANLQ
ncbi:MAG TPA: nucleoside 2-deoxyribosyltransferase [Anaerolineales bacterium]